jgi:hypothetical protein
MKDAQSNQFERERRACWSATAPVASKPGFNCYSFVQGEFAITVVSDGFITVPIDIVAPDGSPGERVRNLTAYR